MIGLPFNDQQCLGEITEVLSTLVEANDPVVDEIAGEHETTESLAAWIRSLPQRDDLGDPDDGPRVEACVPSQRLDIPSPRPNCVERSGMYILGAERIDPGPVRQLATLDTPAGLHTFPLENGAPVVLDPRVARNGLACALALSTPGTVAVAPRDAVEWTAKLAEVGAATHRNGPSTVIRARRAIRALVEEGAAPEDSAAVDAMAWFLTVAERTARLYGARVVAMVRTTAQAIADLADEALARTQRNLAIQIGNTHFDIPNWVANLAAQGAKAGVDVGAVALRAELASLGVDDTTLGMVEQELNRDGLTLGPLAPLPRKGDAAKPDSGKPVTFARFSP